MVVVRAAVKMAFCPQFKPESEVWRFQRGILILCEISIIAISLQPFVIEVLFHIQAINGATTLTNETEERKDTRKRRKSLP